MGRDRGLISLLKTRKADERKALQELKRIEEILIERKRVFRDCELDCEKILQQLSDLEGEHRGAALQQGDASRVESINSFSRALRRKLAKKQAILAKRQEELERASERASVAFSVLKEVRIELKKVETLIDGRERSHRVHGAALEEFAQDELTNQFHSKK